MKITQEVRDYAAAQEMSVTEAVEQGMAEKSAEFKEKGAEVYVEVSSEN